MQTLQYANVDVGVALVKVLRSVLLQNGSNWVRAQVSAKELLATTISVYEKHKFAKDIRTKILMLLCDIVLDVHLCSLFGYLKIFYFPLNVYILFFFSNLYRNDLFTTWLVSLPLMLCQPFVSQHVLSTFSCLVKQQNKMFLSTLEKHVPDIIGKLFCM